MDESVKKKIAIQNEIFY